MKHKRIHVIRLQCEGCHRKYIVENPKKPKKYHCQYCNRIIMVYPQK